MSTYRKFLERSLVLIAFLLTIINIIVSFYSADLYLIVIFAFTGIGLLSLVLLFAQQTFKSVKSFHIAIVGFPRSGKTTLIISLFGEAFARKLPVRVIPRGSQTINLVNKSLELLKKGEAMGPTMDQDMFAFRADATSGRFPFESSVRLEFGDFPGQYSLVNPEQARALHNTEFFKWLSDSDCLMFVIDIGKYLLRGNDYVAEVTSTFRTEWQQYLDVNNFRQKEVKRHLLLIVFSKMDLLYRIPNLPDFKIKTIERSQPFEESVAIFGFGRQTPPIIELTREQLSEDSKFLETAFFEIIQFFKSEAPNTNIIFTSSFGMLNDSRLGFGKLFATILDNTR